MFDFDILRMLYQLPGIIIGLTCHEFAHAKTADLLGDDTPRLQGRTSLNPLVHIDIIGFILIMIVGFGWAKPVQINPYNFKNRKRDDILVSLAGPLTNILLACVFLGLIKVLYFLPLSFLSTDTLNILVNMFFYAAGINVVLCVFNLVPLPPLDGSHIVFGLTGLNNTRFYYKLSQMSTLILLVLIITNILGKIIGPPISFIFKGLIVLFNI